MKWIFAYGSLMWRPGFEYDEKCLGTLQGYHREFNKASIQRWGTPEQPAPTLGIEEGGSATGIVYSVPGEDLDIVMEYLREREGEGFDFPECSVTLSDGREVTAVVAVNDHDASYIGDRSMTERAAMAVRATGEAGTGIEYVLNTAEKIAACGITDEHVSELAALVQQKA